MTAAVDPKSMKTVFYTACCIIPPKDMWEPIQKIRSIHDSAYKRWMPHVNLMFPFVHPSNFPVAHQELTRALSTVKPFDITLKQFCHFDHKKNCVVWLNPETESENQIADLLDTMLTVFPQCDAQKNKNTEQVFHPHLTVGQFAKRETEKKKNEFQSKWNEIKFTVNEIYIISRADQDTPFVIDHVVPLGGQ